ncbi:MAG TPA: DUF2251 domain-containing protein [Blastocatellia bacterium]|jgi:hypothetical protein|nr:DUF2251 domain-containing protein [Blastocatellia bacterium]
MPSTIESKETFLVGKETFVGSKSPTTQYGVFFEDDGDTAYFYGLDASLETNQILDALHIYNVASVVDKEIPSVAQIEWSEDGLQAALFINGYAHAVFDFYGKRGYCRTNFPAPGRKWTSFGHEWSDAALESFR